MPVTTPRRLAGAATTLACVAALLVAAAPPAHAAPVSLAGAHWIWYPEGDPARQRARRHPLPPHAPSPHRPVRSARRSSSSPATTPSTSGSTARRSPARPRAVDSWQQALYVDLAGALRRRRQHARGRRPQHRRRSGRACSAGVRVVAAGGTIDLVTDGAWKACQTPSAGLGAAGDSTTAAGPPRRTRRATASRRGTATSPRPDTAAGLAAGGRRRRPSSAASTRSASTPRSRGSAGSSRPATAGSSCQGAYQVIVVEHERGTGGTGDVWDSGRVASGQSVDVAYGGAGAASLHPLLLAGTGLGRPGPGRAPWSPATLLRDRAVQPGQRVDGRLHRASTTGTGARRRELDLVPRGRSGRRRAAGDPLLPPHVHLPAAPRRRDAGGHRRRHRRRVGQRHPGEHLAAGHRLVEAARPSSTSPAGCRRAPTRSRSPAQNTTAVAGRRRSPS